MLRHSTSNCKPKKRVGAAAVELALVLPLLVTLTCGSIEYGHALNMVQKLEAAVRGGGRLAGKDIDASLAGGLTSNEKVILDITNMLRADGIPATNIDVAITHADGTSVGETFDLSLQTNQHQLMRITVSVPYADVSLFPLSIDESTILSATLVASRGRSNMVH